MTPEEEKRMEQRIKELEKKNENIKVILIMAAIIVGIFIVYKINAWQTHEERKNCDPNETLQQCYDEGRMK